MWKTLFVENVYLTAVILALGLLTLLLHLYSRRILKIDCCERFGIVVAEFLKNSTKEAALNLELSFSVLFISFLVMMAVPALFQNAANDPAVRPIIEGWKTVMVLIAFMMHWSGTRRYVARVLDIKNKKTDDK